MAGVRDAFRNLGPLCRDSGSARKDHRRSLVDPYVILLLLLLHNLQVDQHAQVCKQQDNVLFRIPIINTSRFFVILQDVIFFKLEVNSIPFHLASKDDGFVCEITGREQSVDRPVALPDTDTVELVL